MKIFSAIYISVMLIMLFIGFDQVSEKVYNRPIDPVVANQSISVKKDMPKVLINKKKTAPKTPKKAVPPPVVPTPTSDKALADSKTKTQVEITTPQQTSPIPVATVQSAPPEKEQITPEEMGVWPVFEWQGETVWVATAKSQVGDKVTLTVNNKTYTETVQSISGKNAIWSGFNLPLNDQEQYPATVKLERGQSYTIMSFTIQ